MAFKVGELLVRLPREDWALIRDLCKTALASKDVMPTAADAAAVDRLNLGIGEGEKHYIKGLAAIEARRTLIEYKKQQRLFTTEDKNRG